MTLKPHILLLEGGKKYTQIEPEEPKWLSGGSHTSVFNGGLLGSHFGYNSAPTGSHSCTFMFIEIALAGMIESYMPEWLPRLPQKLLWFFVCMCSLSRDNAQIKCKNVQKKCTHPEVQMKQKRRAFQVFHFKCPS